MTFRLDYSYYDVPDHTKESLENYFFRGFEPGSFVTSVLANDLMGAVTRCDHINKNHIVDISKWVMHNAPHGSWGDMETVINWVQDKDNRRTMYTDAFEKKLAWATLSTQ